jgi:hypothetical protein
MRKIVFEGVSAPFGHDLLHHGQIMLRRARTENLVRRLSLDLVNRRPPPGLQRGRVGVHQTPGLDCSGPIADQLPVVYLGLHGIVPMVQYPERKDYQQAMGIGDFAESQAAVSDTP